MNIEKLVVTMVTSTVLVVGAGYKLPEKSINSLALSNAYVAHTSGADTAYFNPAGMSFMQNDTHLIEMGAMGIHLNAQEYFSSSNQRDGSSEVENLVAPYFFYLSPAMGNFRAGLSFIIPGGLTKRWETPHQKLSAEEFTLKILELNPTLSYKINENFSLGGGVRLVYSEGVVKSDGGDIFPIKREMEGDSFSVGYNVAFLYHAPYYGINYGITYRSKIDLKEKGEANLYFGGIGKQYNAEVSVPLPASLNIGLSKTFLDKYTIEFVFERSFWSAYKALNFEYTTAIYNPVLVSAFDESKTRNWEDSNTFRVGLTADISEKLILMYGFSYDETPVQKEYIGFELADSQGINFSGGVRYQYSPSLSVGASMLYNIKDEIELTPNAHDDKSPLNPLNSGGKFEKGGAILATVGFSYAF